MLGVGIHENVYLAGVTMDDKAVISVTFKESDKAGKATKSMFEMAASDQAEEVDNGATIMLFPPNAPKEDNKKTLEKTVEMLTADITKIKGQCLHILSGYLTSADLAGQMQPFAGLALTDASYPTEIQRKEVLEAVQRNIGNTFLRLITPFVNKPDMKFRLLLVRQSAEKHFATLRGRFLADNPFWESMDVPKAQSKLKFNDYEKGQGLDNGIPIAKDSRKAGAAAAEQAPMSAQNIFGTQ